MAARPLRFAAFGTGYWSTLQIPAWLELGGVELVALCNRTVSRAEAAAARYGVPRVYGDPEELLRREELDFVDIITEVPAHAPLVLLAARYRVPVICQKPMAEDLATCEAMVGACRRAGVPFLIHENFRWQPPMRAVKQVLCEGQIGTPFRADVQLGNGGPESYEVQPFLKSLPHTALTDMGSHAFDLARFFFGEAGRVYCETHRGPAGDAVIEDAFAAVLRFGEVICTCQVSNYLATRVFIEGTRGSIELDEGRLLRIRSSDGREEIRDTRTWPAHPWCSDADLALHGGDCIQSIYECNQHLRDALVSGTEPETSGRDSLKTMRLVFAAIESSVSGRAVAP